MIDRRKDNNDWKLKLNMDKTQAIVYHRKIIQYPPEILIDNTTIKWSNTVKYLGLIIDNRLSWAPAIQDRIKKVYPLFRKLYPLISRKSTLDLRLKRLTYITCVR